MIKIYNTLTKKKENFKPINGNKIKIYVCGITVYDYCHIGHARTFIIFDMMIRYFYYCGYQVNYVRNVTDIGDKITKKSLENNETYKTLTTRIIKKTQNEFKKLNILPPNHEPYASKFIKDIIKFIKELINKKNAYISTNGDVMFATDTHKEYGILSKKNIKHLKTKISNKKEKEKKNPIDFTLWKITKKNEPNWLSPWGYGIPGWHTECLIMSNKYLGNILDIHGGGQDLIFPHHENEMAQLKCNYKNANVNLWIHTGLVNINSEKMSKTFNNTITINSILNDFDSETIRYFLISSHYRSNLIYDKKKIEHAKNSLQTLYISLKDIKITKKTLGGEYFIDKFIKAMNDDFNTPLACSILFEIAHEINILKKKNMTIEIQGIASTLKKLANILGLLKYNPNTYLQKKINNSQTIKKLIKQRNQARKNKQWEIADKIRKKLYNMNINIEDNNNQIN